MTSDVDVDCYYAVDLSCTGRGSCPAVMANAWSGSTRTPCSAKTDTTAAIMTQAPETSQFRGGVKSLTENLKWKARKLLADNPLFVSGEGDQLAALRSDLEEFDELAAAVGECCDAITGAITTLESAPRKIMEKLEGMHKEGTPANQKVARLSLQLTSFATTIGSGEPHLQTMRKLTRQTKSRIAEARATLEKHDEVRFQKAYYSKETSRKVPRYEHRREKVDEELRISSMNTEKCLSDLLSTKWNLTAASLGHLCHYYVCVFKDAQDMVNGFMEISDQLKDPHRSPTEVIPDKLASPPRRRAVGAPTGTTGLPMKGTMNGVRGLLGMQPTFMEAARETKGLAGSQRLRKQLPLATTFSRANSTGSTGSFLRDPRDSPSKGCAL